MKNTNIQKQLKAGDVLHCTGSSFLAKAIQIFSRSRINHSAVILSFWGVLFVMDAQARGVNPMKLSDWMKKHKYDFIISRPVAESFDLVKFSKRCMSRSGITPYDYPSLFFFQLRYQLTGKWKGKTEVQAEKRMYCSEFVAWAYELPEWWKLSPEDVFKAMLISCDFNTVYIVS